jgi:mxaJ protein
VLLALTLLPATFARAALRVCADPNNLPFSNRKEQGFENAIARLIAGELGTTVEYTWWAQRRGFVRNTLKAGMCDVIVGVPASFELAATTRPYYRSTYVFVTRRDRNLAIESLDDPRLRALKIGVQLIGDDGANSPPAHALANRGIVEHVTGFPVYGDYAKENPTRAIIDAVAAGTIDVAAVWGPIAGYFMKSAKRNLVARAMTPQIDLPYLPFVFDIAMGVRRGDDALRERLNGILAKRAPEIDAILARYGVPRVDRSARQATR